MPGAVSVEAEASTVQVSCGQLAVNDATGATFGVSVRVGYEHDRPHRRLAGRGIRRGGAGGRRADRRRCVQVGSDGGDASRPVPREMLRWVWPAGRVQPVVAEDLSAQ